MERSVFKILGLAALALPCTQIFAGQAPSMTCDSGDVMAIRRYSEPGLVANSSQVIGVPWVGMDGEDVAVDRLVATGLADGDELHVYDREKKTYHVWTWDAASKSWAASSSTAAPLEDGPDAKTYKLRRGQACWFKRSSTDVPFAQIGLYTANAATTSLDAAADRRVTNLMRNPNDVAIKIADITADKVEGLADGDAITVLVEGQLSVEYVRRGGAWGRLVWAETELPTFLGGGTQKKQTFVDCVDETIPAEAGFWYTCEKRAVAPVFKW